jgi:hypothetical protein
MFVPHDDPFVALLPVSMQVGVPVEQSSLPVWQAVAGGHEASCVHVLHVPFKQTWFVPHRVPFGTLLPVSVQTPVPVEQLIAPA